MPNTTWILVANASTAKLYANDGPHHGLELLKEFDHPDSRRKNSDLSSDRAGAMQMSGNGHGARQPQSTPKENSARHFAQELAGELHNGRCCNAANRMILVAPPAFMGLLNATLDGPTGQIVSNRFEKDYTKAPPQELATKLETCIYL